MDSIVQAILNLSKLEVHTIRITQPTADTFVMSIDSKTTHTGPLPATMAPMTVDLVGPKGPYAKLDLPEVKTTSKGAVVAITDQHIKITNMEAYIAFVKAIQLDEKLTMYLDNGQGTIKALGMKSKIVYKKPVHISGMDGPQMQVLKTELLPDGGFKNTMKIINPSPLEIDMGNVSWAFKNAAGETLATQSANLFIKKGETIYESVGKVHNKGDISRVNLVGDKEERSTWVQQALNFVNVPITLTPELANLLKA